MFYYMTVNLENGHVSYYKDIASISKEFNLVVLSYLQYDIDIWYQKMVGMLTCVGYHTYRPVITGDYPLYSEGTLCFNMTLILNLSIMKSLTNRKDANGTKKYIPMLGAFLLQQIENYFNIIIINV